MFPGRIEWALAGLAGLTLLAAVVFFGGVQPELGGPIAAVLAACGGLLLLRAPGSAGVDDGGRTLQRAWSVAAIAFPAWLILQTVPLPAGLVDLLSPARLAWARDAWPGPLTGCGGASLVAAAQPSFLSLSIEPHATREFLFRVVAALVVFFAARALFAAHPRHRQYLLGGIAVVTALEAVYGLWQWVTKSPQVLWVAKTAYVDVATGTLINRNHYAALLYLGLGCTLALLMLRLDERPGRDDAGRETAIRTTLALLAALQFAGIAASQSRAGIAGGLLVLGCALPLFLRARRAFRLAGLAVLAIVLLPTILLTLPQLLERLGRVPDEWSSAGGRGAVARTTARLVADFPLFGTGGASFEVAFARYRTPEISGLYDYAHNDYLQTLTETGVAGLAAALLPVALFVVALVRARRGGRFPDHGPPRLWPVYGALAALALHEFVDFNLQIPALAFVTALLAGAFFPGPAESRPAPRSRVLSVLALVVALPALAHGAARWPVVGPLLPAPDLPEAHAAAAMEALGTWRAGRTSGAEPAQAPDALLCGAIEQLAEAQRLRPVAERYAVEHARLLVAAAELPATADGERARWQAEASRLTAKARAANPSDPWMRERLMGIALALGELPQAIGDAEAVTRMSPELAPQVVRELLGLGLPATAIVRVTSASPVAYRTTVHEVMKSGDLDTARKIVPADVASDLVTCSAGDVVTSALVKAYGADGERFLSGCLGVPGLTEIRREHVLVWLAADRLRCGADAAAAAALAQVKEPLRRAPLELSLAERRKDWATAAVLAARLLDRARPANPDAEAALRYRYARALAQSGQLATARSELEAALALNPFQADAERALYEIRLGRNPFGAR